MKQIILFLLINLNLYSHNKNTSENHEININNNDETNQEQLIPVENIIHWKVKHKNQNTTIKFKINNYKWKWSWDQKSTIIGNPSQYSFFIKINGQLIEVYLPQSIEWKVFINNFSHFIKIEYKINNVDYIFRSSIATKENHNNKEIFLRNNNNYGNSICPLNFLNMTETKNQNNIQIYKFFNKDKTKTLEIFFNQQKKSIEKYIIKDKKFIFSETADENIYLNFNEYPKNLPLIANDNFRNIIMDVSNNISSKINCYITNTYILDNFLSNIYYSGIFYNIKKIILKFFEYNRNLPNIQEIISKIANDKPYILIIIPIRIKSSYYFSLGYKYHFFPMGLLFEKFNNIWILKKIISTETGNNFLFLNYEFKKFMDKLLTNSQEQILNLIYKNQDIKNKNINKFSFFDNGNTYVEMTDFIQTRQSTHNCCYSSCYRDMLRIVEYTNNLINNKNHIFQNSLLSIKDLYQIFVIEQNYNMFDKNQLKTFIESLLIQHESNIAFHHFNENFIIYFIIENKESLGGLIDEHKILKQKKLDILRKIYHIFFIKINNEIYSYLIYRSHENQLDNKRYYDIVQSTIKNIYPHWKVHPLKYVSLKDFNKNHPDMAIIYLLKIFNSNGLMPCIYKPLTKYSYLNYHHIKKNLMYMNIFLGSFQKSIVPDYSSDSFIHILFLLTKLDISNKEKLINILIDIMKNK